MATCDLCGKKVPLTEMTTLLDAYKIDGVEDICKECTDWTNKQRIDLLCGVSEKLKERIAARSEEFSMRVPHAAKHKWSWRSVFARGEGK